MTEKFETIKKELEGTVLEFFLGKNVIAKIAVFLIFLGVFSFGQLAYIDWLNDVGRVVFIGSIGIITSIIGYYFERCESTVFSNVFYVLALCILFITNTLSNFTYHLYSYDIFVWINLLFMVGSYLYFSLRRTEFIDVVTMVLYSIIVTFPLYYLSVDATNIAYVASFVTLALYAVITYMNWFNMYKHHPWMHIVLFTIFSGVLLYYIFFPTFLQHPAEFQIIHVFYLLFGYVFLVFGNVLFLQRESVYDRISFSFAFLILVLLLSINTAEFIDFYVYGVEVFQLTCTILTVTVLPLYLVLLFIQKNTMANVYLSFLSFLFILWTLLASEGYIQNVKDQYTGILIAWILLLLVLHQLRPQKGLQHAITWLSGFLLFLGVLYTLIEQPLKYHDLQYYLLPFLTILLLVVPIITNRLIQKDRYIIVYLLLVLGYMIPISLTLVNEWFQFDEILFVWTTILVIIGYRYVLKTSLFKSNYIQHLEQFMILKIVLLVLVANFYYFDHNLTVLSDVMFLLFTLAINGYLVIALYDLYHLSTMSKMDEEVQFIIIYITGAIIQSIWIHRYINIEFDKVILSSYFMIASAIGILIGFRNCWQLSRKIGLGVIYFSLAKFFIYDFFTQDFTTFVRMMTYFILGFTLLGISFLYSYLEKTYGSELQTNNFKPEITSITGD